MRPRTLVARVAWTQATVTLLALAIVALATPIAVSAVLRSRTDQELTQVAARVASLVEPSELGGSDRAAIEREIQELRPPGVRVDVRAYDDRLIAAGGEPIELAGSGPGCVDRDVRKACGDPAGPFRVCGTRAGQLTIVTATSRSRDRAALFGFTAVLLVACTIAGLAVALLIQRITRRALGPLDELAASVNAIKPGSGRRTGMRCELAELERLRTRFDELVDRFEDALGREQRLAAQASHELRTPLTVARAEIEALSMVTAQAPESTRALAALDRLSALIDALLWFARAQGKLDDARIGVVNVADLVRAELARDPLRTLDVTLPEEALVRGDEHLLRRVTANLIENAFKHGADGTIEVIAERTGDVLRLQIVNAGSPPAQDLRERIFEPFYRGGAADSNVPGFGLGLPFARAVARAHSGDVVLASKHDSVTAFIVTLPLVGWCP